MKITVNHHLEWCDQHSYFSKLFLYSVSVGKGTVPCLGDLDDGGAPLAKMNFIVNKKMRVINSPAVNQKHVKNH